MPELAEEIAGAANWVTAGSLRAEGRALPVDVGQRHCTASTPLDTLHAPEALIPRDGAQTRRVRLLKAPVDDGVEASWVIRTPWAHLGSLANLAHLMG